MIQSLAVCKEKFKENSNGWGFFLSIKPYPDAEAKWFGPFESTSGEFSCGFVSYIPIGDEESNERRGFRFIDEDGNILEPEFDLDIMAVDVINDFVDGFAECDAYLYDEQERKGLFIDMLGNVTEERTKLGEAVYEYYNEQIEPETLIEIGYSDFKVLDFIKKEERRRALREYLDSGDGRKLEEINKNFNEKIKAIEQLFKEEHEKTITIYNGENPIKLEGGEE